MASPIAGNESFTNVDNLVGSLNNLDVASLTVNTVVAENATIDTQSLLSDLKPTFEGLAVATVATGANLVYAANTITVNNFTEAAAQQVNLPAATAGTIVVHAQAIDTAGDGSAGTLTFDCVGTDVFFTGSNIRSTNAGAGTMDTSTAGETQLVFTPANATTNLLTVGCKVYFWCVNDGTWHIAADLSTEPAVSTGTFAFAA
tara:strand:- start:2422 stop:3027 length:606 start_codon:yes stop_codon:yes gene_type:complete